MAPGGSTAESDICIANVIPGAGVFFLKFESSCALDRTASLV